MSRVDCSPSTGSRKALSGVCPMVVLLDAGDGLGLWTLDPELHDAGALELLGALGGLLGGGLLGPGRLVGLDPGRQLLDLAGDGRILLGPLGQLGLLEAE